MLDRRDGLCPDGLTIRADVVETARPAEKLLSWQEPRREYRERHRRGPRVVNQLVVKVNAG